MSRNNKNRSAVLSIKEKENIGSSDSMSEDPISKNFGDNTMSDVNTELEDKDDDGDGDVSATENETNEINDSDVVDLTLPPVVDTVVDDTEDSEKKKDEDLVKDSDSDEDPVNDIVIEEKKNDNLADLTIDDTIEASVKNVPNFSGNGKYSVKDLLKYQFTFSDSCIILSSENLKKPFLVLLKSIQGFDKMPVISSSARSVAVRRFMTTNNINE